MNIPMKTKYIDQAIGIYSIFGYGKDGTVDVSDGNKDVFEGLPLDVAEKLIAAHDIFRQSVYDLLGYKDE